MTTAKWNDEMLDKLSKNIATQMTADREERNLVLQALTRQGNELEFQQTEIRELRLETRRILNYLLNEKDADEENE